MFIVIYNRSHVSVYRIIGPLVCFVVVVVFFAQTVTIEYKSIKPGFET